MDNFYNECPAKMEDGRFLTDYRSSNTREQYIKQINGIVNTNDYRSFLIDNGEKILDAEWQYISSTNSCGTKSCVHTSPLRPSLGVTSREMQLYNSVQTGKIKPTDENYPHCKKYEDYRMTDTKKTKY